MKNFSVTRYGKPLDDNLYNWDDETRTFSTSENNLILDFSNYSNCTFKTGSNCTFDTGFDCVLVRRDVFEFYNISNKKITTAPYEIEGYVEDGYYYLDGVKQYPAIITDGILSEIINQKGNVFKVKNYRENNISYLVKDGDIYSHGKTLKQAKENLIYKISNRDTSTYNDYNLNTILTFEEAIKMYRVITGACESGTRYFVEQNQDKKRDKYSIKEIIELTKGQYGNDKLIEFFGGK